MSTNQPFIAVREVIFKNPVQVDGMATVQEALQLMRDNKVSALVVKRRNERDEFGFVLMTDIAKVIVAQNKSLARTNVYEIMIKPAPSLDSDMDIKYAIRHMTRFDLSHCIVLHGRELAGVVTLNEMTMRYVES